MQVGGGEARDGVSVGLAEETHGAERVAAEERGGGAQGDEKSCLSSLLYLRFHSQNLRETYYWQVLAQRTMIEYFMLHK